MSDFYNPKEIEKDYYEFCKQKGYFEIDGNKNIQENGKNFAIMMPPPNVTGVLHIGHALTFTLQDIITRYKRMDGFKVLYQPGLDHAGIATQNVVEKQLLAKGIKKEELGREKFIEKVWEWKEQSGGAIVKQMQALGITPAFSRLRFTMDEGLQNAVKKAFVDLYNKGLIEQNNRMINWCTKDGALSDIEVEYEENKGKLYHIRYFLNDKDYLVVATTRPETYFGDTAVMINPEDERYKHLVGKEVTLPIINRKIKIIADSHVDMSFGTGIVKVTPAHDNNDYEVGLRHNLEFLTIFDENGILNEHCAEFAGLERLEARKIVVDKLNELGFIEKIEDYVNQVGHCYRCKNIVEPYISKQWFVKTDIATKVIEKVNNGDAKFYPAHWINSFNAWLRELRPWCISRQLWWGHQIPVYYCDECEHIHVSESKIEKCEKCGCENITQDKDVLDTWFSSGLWAFSTLGYNNGDFGKGTLWNESDIKDFYPNSLLITGFDILFFWVCRMLFQSENELGEIPFKDIYLHALVKDENGQKMSKSKGNVIDPLDSIDKYSADILRFTLALLAVQGRDIRMSEDRMILVRNFTNKLYNAVNFLLLKGKDYKILGSYKTTLGIYINAEFQKCVNETRKNLDEYRFNDAAMNIYKFLWDEFCDYGIEFSKADESSIDELASVFLNAMKLLSPFMPFISDYLYHKLGSTSIFENGSIMVEKYPKINEISTTEEQIIKNYELCKEAINSLRSIKKTANITDKNAPAQIISEHKFDEYYLKLIAKLAKVGELSQDENPKESFSVNVSTNLKTAIFVDSKALDEMKAKLENRYKKVLVEYEKLNKMLSNEKFVANAPAQVVEQNKIAMQKAENELNEIKAELNNIG